MLVPLIGTDHVGDFILVFPGIICDAADPECGRTQQKFRAVLPHELVIASYIPVVPEGVSDTRSDMQFDSAVDNGDEFAAFRVDDRAGRGLTAIQRTFPGEL